MRRVFTASLFIVGLTGNALSHRNSPSSPLRRRKTLGFGPEHPNAVFHTNPHEIGFAPMSPNSDPFEVADRFVKDILGTRLTEYMSYGIRSDSYTDSNTGVTHVYVRQIVNGLEVTNGDMNINIKDGMVLSYGTSFYNGHVPQYVGHEDTSLMTDPYREYCTILSNRLDSRTLSSDGGQQTLTDPHLAEMYDLELTHIHRSNCRHENLPYELPRSFHSGTDIPDFRHALLHFMVAATPSDDVVEDILGNFDKHLDGMAIKLSTSAGDILVSNVPDTVNPVKARLAYIQVPSQNGEDTHLAVVWRFEVEMQDNWYEAAVSANAPHRIISVVDWAFDSSAPTKRQLPAGTYSVFAWGLNDPTEGTRTFCKENFDALASPVGWHTLPYTHDPSYVRRLPKNPMKDFWRNTTTTWGNNAGVFVQENWGGTKTYHNRSRPDAGYNHKVFSFSYSPSKTPTDEPLLEAHRHINYSCTQLFYTTNMVHDFFYRYGFDEVSGNFQQYNFGRGGFEFDGVIADAQDGFGFESANFVAPPDGYNGRMRVSLWKSAIPYRDGDLDAGIVIHELSHGLSNRLTGGPKDSGCLGWGESRGMGEGWGDYLATMVRSKRVPRNYAMGAWVMNWHKGMRKYTYSTNKTVNPSTYETLNDYVPGWEPHPIGQVWAEILWVVSQGLIEKHGFIDDLFPPKPDERGNVPPGDFYRTLPGKKLLVPRYGNSLAVQLVINGMKLQKCRPSFFDARDAIIQADHILTGGENFCTLWKGFADRGLGLDAKIRGSPMDIAIRTNGYALPVACK